MLNAYELIQPPYDADNASPPHWRHSQMEWPRTVSEFTATYLSWSLLDHWPHGDGHPVMVLPGFLAGNSTTILLRKILQRLGYVSYDWGQGFNWGLRDGLEERMINALKDVAQRHSTKVSLIGWSLGGVFARELARENPELVRTVITMGSPFRGNHRAHRSWWIYSLINRESHHHLQEDARRRRAEPLTVPTTCIYSRSDGIVAWECCTSVPAPLTENIEVHSSHLGYGHNLESLYVVADRLAQPQGAWQPYKKRTHR